jgi:hypothetical protein
MNSSFTGKAGLVTGAGAGIGAATAKHLAAAGASVLVADVRLDAAEATAQEIVSSGGTAKAVHCDVAVEDHVNAMVAEAAAQFGALDFAVNNAATSSKQAPLHEVPVAEWDRLMNVNLRGVFLCLRAEVPAMRTGGGGAIVNISSGMGLRAMPGMTAYGASKHGVIGLSKVAALDYAAEGIRVNVVCPASVATGLPPEALKRLSRVAPMGRLGHPDEAANLIAFLLSDEASYLTAGVYTADGGGLSPVATAWASGAFFPADAEADE